MIFQEWFCVHKYELLDKKTFRNKIEYINTNESKEETGWIIVQICKKCGKIKRSRVGVFK